MPLSMYRASVPVFTQVLTCLAGLIDKAAAHADAHGFDPALLTGYRLAPDMLPFARQIQIATDMAKNGASRLAGHEPPSFPDTETTLDELKERIERALHHVQSFRPDEIDGSEEHPITIKIGGHPTTLTGERYLINFVLPNVLFHATTAYDILRHAGLPLGKKDFLGEL